MRSATGHVVPPALLVRCNHFVLLNVLCKCGFGLGIVGVRLLCGTRLITSRGCAAVVLTGRK